MVISKMYLNIFSLWLKLKVNKIYLCFFCVMIFYIDVLCEIKVGDFVNFVFVN